jgi:hypothetical protein
MVIYHCLFLFFSVVRCIEVSVVDIDVGRAPRTGTDNRTPMRTGGSSNSTAGSTPTASATRRGLEGKTVPRTSTTTSGSTPTAASSGSRLTSSGSTASSNSSGSSSRQVGGSSSVDKAWATPLANSGGGVTPLASHHHSHSHSGTPLAATPLASSTGSGIAGSQPISRGQMSSLQTVLQVLLNPDAYSSPSSSRPHSATNNSNSNGGSTPLAHSNSMAPPSSVSSLASASRIRRAPRPVDGHLEPLASTPLSRVRSGSTSSTGSGDGYSSGGGHLGSTSTLASHHPTSAGRTRPPESSSSTRGPLPPVRAMGRSPSTTNTSSSNHMNGNSNNNNSNSKDGAAAEVRLHLEKVAEQLGMPLSAVLSEFNRMHASSHAQPPLPPTLRDNPR